MVVTMIVDVEETFAWVGRERGRNVGSVALVDVEVEDEIVISGLMKGVELDEVVIGCNENTPSSRAVEMLLSKPSELDISELLSTLIRLQNAKTLIRIKKLESSMPSLLRGTCLSVPWKASQVRIFAVVM
jgi:hypothetical protein